MRTRRTDRYVTSLLIVRVQLSSITNVLLLPQAIVGVPYEKVRAEIQASDAELARGLSKKHILNIRGEPPMSRCKNPLMLFIAGYLRPIASDYLSRILELLLALLVSLGLSPDAAPLEDLAAPLQDEHEIRREVCEQVAGWFGTLENGIWKVNAEKAAAQIGLGIIAAYRVRSNLLLFLNGSIPNTESLDISFIARAHL
jgi:hypothetical protein